jgi:hypothetical protein
MRLRTELFELLLALLKIVVDLNAMRQIEG